LNSHPLQKGEMALFSTNTRVFSQRTSCIDAAPFCTDFKATFPTGVGQELDPTTNWGDSLMFGFKNIELGQRISPLFITRWYLRIF